MRKVLDATNFIKNKEQHPLNVVFQKTLKSSISCTGIGLHTGQNVSMAIIPAEENHGIVFQRTDLKKEDGFIPASWDHIVDTQMSTTIGNVYGARVATIEHLMAALSGCGIDNAVVEINGPEVPVMDGSAEPFVFLIECVGIKELTAPRRAIKIVRDIQVEDENCFINAKPEDSFSISFEIDFEDVFVGRQRLDLQFVNGTFKTDIARARTFGFLDEVNALRKAGLARGGSLENAIVISGNSILNNDGLRYKDEFVRHKILDCVGDLYLAGAPILGRIDAFRSGHALNKKFLKELFQNEHAWSYVDFSEIPSDVFEHTGKTKAPPSVAHI
ncbi:MAG: UDP-3-O-acyl-N-acetylglucosamine deacetylase [Pseudomonadota bacterium]|nr:UDP-3-O-acyl-N-acetylglucosamine deacetylase [Pseudomonadota bacterium]